MVRLPEFWKSNVSLWLCMTSSSCSPSSQQPLDEAFPGTRLLLSWSLDLNRIYVPLWFQCSCSRVWRWFSNVFTRASCWLCIHHRLHILGNGCGKASILWRRTFHRMGALRWLHLRCESAFVVDLLPFLNISQCIHLLSRWNIQFAMLGEKKKIDANQFCDHLGSNKNLRWIEWIR